MERWSGILEWSTRATGWSAGLGVAKQAVTSGICQEEIRAVRLGIRLEQIHDGLATRPVMDDLMFMSMIILESRST